MNIKPVKLGLKIAAVTFTSLFGVIQTASMIAIENKDILSSSFFHEKTYELVQSDDNQDTDYFTTDYDSIASLRVDTEKTAEEVEANGAVLLKNENNALPIDAGSNVSLFGYGSVDPFTVGGSGSAAPSNPIAPDTLKDGLEANGISVNETLWNFYKSGKNKYAGTGNRINDASWTDLSTTSGSFASYGDAAIFVIRRSRGEGADPAFNESSSVCDGENGNYLALNNNEKSVLKGLAGLKGTVFQKIIVLINSANQMELNFLDNEEYAIDSCMWIGTVGQKGMSAVAKLLAGEVNPSGHLPDTYYYYNKDNPTMANFGVMKYANYNEYKSMLPVESDASYSNMCYATYLVYKEGIYVGYKYSETRYEDVVMGVENAGNFDYSNTIAYPFGYGLSYTTFSYSNFKVTYNSDNDTYRVTVTVKNEGEVAGKDAVQIYVQKPYTEYDKINNIEKSSIDLVGFGKTNLLNPKQSENYEITIDGSELASYDSNSEKTYILDEGDYYFTVGQDSHDAINNVLAQKNYTQTNGMTSNGNKALVQSFHKSFNAEKYSKSLTGEEITNQFDEGNINTYSNAGTNSVTYVSRSNWEGTLPASNNDHVILNLNADMVQELNDRTTSNMVAPDDGEYPTYGANNGLTLVDLRVDSEGNEISFDDETWDLLLDELTWEETCNLLSYGKRQTTSISSIAKPGTIEHNGPFGVSEAYTYGSRGLATIYGDPDGNYSPTYYPCIGILAATFDTKLASTVGTMYGEDALWAGYSGLYGIGLNIHRTAYDGRISEYYSEDPFLSGYMASFLVKNLQAKGCNAYLKHLAVYEQQANRVGLTIWSNEQTLRETYLKPFQLAIEKGKARNIMVAYTRIGVQYCTGNEGLLTGFVRNECGLTGLIVSDMYDNRYSDNQIVQFVMAGLDLPDGDRGPGIFSNYATGYSQVAWKMRLAAKHILYSVVHSNAMNGLSSGTTIRLITPRWLKTVKTARISSEVLCGISVVGFVGLVILDELKKHKVFNHNK